MEEDTLQREGLPLQEKGWSRLACFPYFFLGGLEEGRSA